MRLYRRHEGSDCDLQYQALRVFLAMLRIAFTSSTLWRLPHSLIYTSRLCRSTYSWYTGLTMPPADPPPDLIVPDGYTLHSENTSHILLPSDNGAFLNPVQEFNRDLSVACIRVWGEQMDEAKKLKWEQERERKAQKAESKAKKQKRKSAATPYI